MNRPIPPAPPNRLDPIARAPIPLVLASTSRYRAQILGRLAVPFVTASPDIDERAAAWSGLAPEAMALALACAKALAVAARPEHAGRLVIGSDQVAVLDGELLHKPGTVASACAQLERMAGRAHRLVTAVAVTRAGPDAERELHVATDTHILWMRPLSDALIAAYVAADQPLDCAGSYRLEARGLALFDRIEADPETADDTAIIGLPLMKTVALLRKFGFEPLAVPAVPLA